MHACAQGRRLQALCACACYNTVPVQSTVNCARDQHPPPGLDISACRRSACSCSCNISACVLACNAHCRKSERQQQNEEMVSCTQFHQYSRVCAKERTQQTAARPPRLDTACMRTAHASKSCRQVPVRLWHASLELYRYHHTFSRTCTRTTVNARQDCPGALAHQGWPWTAWPSARRGCTCRVFTKPL